MNPLFRIVLAIIWVVLPFSAVAQTDPTVGTTEVPEWADFRDVPEFPDERRAEVIDGLGYIARQTSVNWSEGGYDLFYTLSYEITGRSGLEYGARVEPSFDPETETLDFTFIRIIRDDETIDALSDAEIELLRQEEGLDKGLIDGRMTALVELEGIGVGDIVQYGIVQRVDTPLWPNDYFTTFTTEFSVPLILNTYKLIMPADKDVSLTAIETDAEVVKTVADDKAIYTAELFDADPVQVEQNTPRNQIDQGFIEITTMDTWADVVDWGTPVYTFTEPLPADFQAELDRISATYSDESEQIIQVLRWVQDEIRYLGLEGGLGSHAPRAPATTLDRGYGDCKDKTILLVAGLRYLGIEAHPALTHSDGETLDQLPPSIHAFNHVITEVIFDGRSWWVDPTLSLRGGTLEDLSYLGYGFALPLKASQADLVALDEPYPATPTTEIVEAYTLQEDGEFAMELKVLNRFESFAADNIRYSLASKGEQAFVTEYHNYYSQLMPGIETASDTVITDQIDENIITIEEHYRMTREDFNKNGMDEDLPVYASAVRDVLPTSVEAGRLSDLAIARNTHKRHRVSITTPGRTFSAPDSLTIDDHGIKFERVFVSSGETLNIDYVIEITEPVVPRRDIRDVIKLSEQIADVSNITINTTAAQPTLARRLGMTEIDPVVETAISQSLEFYEDERYTLALGKLNNIVDDLGGEGQLYGYVEYLRGAILDSLDRDRAALEAFDNGFANYEPYDTGYYFNYLNLLWQTDRDQDVIDTTVRMLTEHTASFEDMNVEWFQDMTQQLYNGGHLEDYSQLILAAAAAQNTLDDDFAHEEWVYWQALQLLIEQDAREDAQTYVRRIDTPDLFLGLLADNRRSWLWPEIEAKIGGSFEVMLADRVDETNKAQREAPGDFGAKRDYLRALFEAGFADDAVEYGREIVEDWGTVEAVGIPAAWFVNDYAYVLAATGEADEGVKLLSKTLTLGIDDNPDLINMAINRSLMLLYLERYGEAMASALIYSNSGRASDYGTSFLYHVLACGNHRQGQVEAAETILTTKLEPIWKTNPGNYIGTLLCLERYDAAEAAYLERYQTGDFESDPDLFNSFQAYSRPEFVPPLLAELLDAAEDIRARPDVKKAYEAVGRRVEFSGQKLFYSQF